MTLCVSAGLACIPAWSFIPALGLPPPPPLLALNTHTTPTPTDHPALYRALHQRPFVVALIVPYVLCQPP
jgi:hypothetical protein